jgi:hypothetical protein
MSSSSSLIESLENSFTDNSNESSCMQILKKVKKEYFENTGTNILNNSNTSQPYLTKASANGQPKSQHVQKNPVDYALFMKGSFRVGFGPNGQIVHGGKFLFAEEGVHDHGKGILQVEKIDTLRWMKKTTRHINKPNTNINQYFEGIFNSIKQTSQKNINFYNSNENNTPEWKAPQFDLNPSINLLNEEQDRNSRYENYIKFLNLLKDCMNSYRNRKLDPKHPDWLALKAVELINSSIGQEEKQIFNDLNSFDKNYIPMLESKGIKGPSYYERRYESISKWFENLSNIDIDQDLLDNKNTNNDRNIAYKQIFELLSCKRIYDSITIAEDVGLFRLATILSQLDGDSVVVDYIRKQVLCWCQADYDRAIDPDLLKIYRLIGGFLFSIEDTGDSILRGMGWVRGISTLYWYNSNNICVHPKNKSKLSYALDTYKDLMINNISNIVDIPRSSYDNDTDVMGSIVNYNPESKDHTQHGLYSLLLTLFPILNDKEDSSNINFGIGQEFVLSSDNLLTCLRSEGYTRDSLDYRTSYLLLNLLECVNIDKNIAIKSYASIIRSHIIFQLTSIGMWKWAIFVAMQCKDVFQRNVLVKDLILRYLDTSANYNDELELIDIGVPSVWISEAYSYRYGYVGFDNKQSFSIHQKYNRSEPLTNIELQVHFLIQSKHYNEAKEIVCSKLVPSMLLLGKFKEHNFDNDLFFNQFFEENNKWHITNSRSEIFQSYFNIYRRYKQTINNSSNLNSEKLKNILGDSSVLLEKFSSKSFKSLPFEIGSVTTTPLKESSNPSYLDIVISHMSTMLFEIISNITTQINGNTDSNYMDIFYNNFIDSNVFDDKKLVVLNKKCSNTIEKISRNI